MLHQIDLTGWWHIKFDARDEGAQLGWAQQLFALRIPQERVRWSEDLPADYLSRLADIFMRFPNIVGEIVWTFADFRVSDWVDAAHPTLYRPCYLERPAQTNHKGMVDFYRRPKQAYYVLRSKFAEWQRLL
jgi:beta-glucuronidase